MDALPLNLRLRKGGIPYPRLKMNINSSDLCSRVTRYWALSDRISDMGDAPSITKHAFGIRTHEVVVFQTSLLGKWVQVSILKLVSLWEFHPSSLGDFWTYCWRLLSDCSILAVWSNLNQQPIHSHLPRQKGSCKQISPTFVTYPASFLNAVFPLFFWILNYATLKVSTHGESNPEALDGNQAFYH